MGMMSGGLSRTLRESDAGELPAGWRLEEVSVSGANVAGGSDDGAAAEDHLAAHEFAVVFAECAGEGAIAGVGGVGRVGPLPDGAVERVEAGGLEDAVVEGLDIEEAGVGGRLGGSGGFPLELGGQAGSGPVGEGVGLVIAEVADGGIGEG